MRSPAPLALHGRIEDGVMGSCDGYGYPSCYRGSLENRVRQDHCRSRANRARHRSRRRTRLGRSRRCARAVAGVGHSLSGEPILLLGQNRALWDQLLIRRGLTALERAEKLGGALGPYALQAAIAACHARARTPEETDWPRIVALYDALAQLTPSPIVGLNRAVAVAMAFGPAEGLKLVDTLTSEPSLGGYHLLPSVRGDLLTKLGRLDEAGSEFERAPALTRNSRERDLLHERARTCVTDSRCPEFSVLDAHKKLYVGGFFRGVSTPLSAGLQMTQWLVRECADSRRFLEVAITATDDYRSYATGGHLVRSRR